MGLWFFDGWFFVFSGIVPGNFSAIIMITTQILRATCYCIVAPQKLYDIIS
jgi:hypothetical protein